MTEELSNKIDKVLAKVVDIDAYIHEHLVTERKLEEVKSELISHIDGFIKLHETLDQELVAMRAKVDRLEGRLEKVETKLGLASA